MPYGFLELQFRVHFSIKCEAEAFAILGGALSWNKDEIIQFQPFIYAFSPVSLTLSEQGIPNVVAFHSRNKIPYKK